MTSPSIPKPTPASALPSITYAGGATNGVATMVPPADLLPSITAAITKACTAIPPGRNAALVAVADQRGANVAAVQRVNDHVTVVAWLGKSWGKPLEGGASVMASW